MSMRLIKLTEHHYIIVDDSEIKEGDYYLFTWGGEQEIQRFFKEQYVDRENHRHLYNNACKKITHSTQPFNFDFIEPLVLSEVKELIGEVDVEEKAWKYNPVNKLDNEFIRAGYIKGYNQALEDNKEKVIIFICKYLGVEKDSIIYNKIIKNWEQSIQPKTEWNVEIVDGNLKLK